MGTPDFSVPTLTALAAQGHEVVACYTQPPRPAGRRGLELTKSPVHRQAEALGIPVRTPKSLKSEEEQALFRDLDADAAVVVAYGLLLPEPVLSGTRSAATTAMPRCCRAGAAPRRSSARSWPAMPRPA
jgi:methionyl-tRNA formyltransferase